MNKGNLKRLRKAAGLTQFRLAREAGISHMRLVYAELGSVQLKHDEVERVKQAIVRIAQRNTARIEAALGGPLAVQPKDVGAGIKREPCEGE